VGGSLTGAVLAVWPAPLRRRGRPVVLPRPRAAGDDAGAERARST
jgi:hypothetical protein